MSKRLLVAGLVISVFPLVASADSKAEARQHIERATKYHQDGKLAEALDELKTAYALDPQPDLLYAMGQIHVGLGQCAQAITYYERYLTTKPEPGTANAAKEAIDACKTNPPRVVDNKPAEPDPGLTKSETPKPEEPAAQPTPHKEPVATSATWYSDYVADGLAVAGIAGGIFGIIEWRGAVSDRSSADGASSYQAYSDLIDRARSKQTLAVIAGGGGAALVAAGALHFMLSAHGSKSVAVIPAGGGGMLTVTGRF